MKVNLNTDDCYGCEFLDGDDWRCTAGEGQCPAVYVLTEWGCLSSVLTDYDVRHDHITPAMGKHMVEDFMERMVKAWHVGKAEQDG